MSNTLVKTFPRVSARTVGVLIALLGGLLMSLDPVFIRFSGVGGFDTAFLFGLFTAVSMPLFIHFRDQRGLVKVLTISGWPVLLSGVLMLGSASTLILSIMNTSIANTFVILSAAPALAAVFSRLFLGEVTKGTTWLAIVSVMAGIGIVVSGSFGSGNLTGDALAVFCVICLSLNQILLRKYQDVSRTASVGLGGMFLALVMFFFAQPSSFSAETWIIMGTMGLFTAPFGRVLSQVATRYMTAPEAGMVLMIKAVFAPVWAFVFFAEVPPAASIIGGAVILLTILIYAASTVKQA
ncbi:DMT family transporter [Psychromonas ossibalaenae]|uniref:DMT family transporter n=1 Tax=Psychromonas ossibalaenae TaxID=444922 RepID=UPI0003A969F9|nr:DMT family transporter [Psychromonas ossibalaenae]